VPAPSRSPQPTPTELEILRVLWRQGPCTVREVHEDLRDQHPVGYTTILKLLQIMVEKGIAVRDESARSHVYRAAISEDRTKRRLVSELVDRAFDGSAADLIVQALSARRVSPDELQQIRELLDAAARREP
jgi:BlaI family transcriptional regulator, penicillinase repressor